MTTQYPFRSTMLALGVALLPAAGRSEGGPPLAPPRDLTVTYLVTHARPDSNANKVRLTYVTQGPMIRVDSYAFKDGHVPFSTMIYDGTAHKRFLLMYQLQAYIENAMDRPNMPEVVLDESMQFARRGTATIAGRQCIDWQIVTGQDDAPSVCVTTDGIVLRSASPVRTIEASGISDGAEADATIAVPSDLRRLQPSQLPVQKTKPDAKPQR